MFPESEHTPAGGPQDFRCFVIALLVGRQLVTPPERVVFGTNPVQFTTVPEAPIDEYRQASAGEGNVDCSPRPTGYGIVDTETMTGRVKSLSKSEFRPGVAPSLSLHLPAHYFVSGSRPTVSKGQ